MWRTRLGPLLGCLGNKPSASPVSPRRLHWAGQCQGPDLSFSPDVSKPRPSNDQQDKYWTGKALEELPVEKVKAVIAAKLAEQSKPAVNGSNGVKTNGVSGANGVNGSNGVNGTNGH